MKHLFIEINIRNGNYEETTYYLKRAKSKDIHKIGENVAKNHYFDLKWDNDFSGFSNGEVAVTCQNVSEISLSDFNVMKKYLTVL